MIFTIDTVMKFDGMQTIRGLITVKDMPLTFHRVHPEIPQKTSLQGKGFTLEANSINLRVICLYITNSPAGLNRVGFKSF